MAARTITLIDVDNGTYIEELTEEFRSSAGVCSASKQRLRGGLSDGVDVVRLDNGALKVDVLPTRGMGLWKAWLKSVRTGDDEFGWRSPVRGPVHPAFVPIGEYSGLGWLDGFDELLVRCGLESNGAPEFDEQGRVRYPLHGRIANKPARKLTLTADDATGELSLTGVVEEVVFFQTVKQGSWRTSKCRLAPFVPWAFLSSARLRWSAPASSSMKYTCSS